ncbi:alpha/beta hydrolase [Ornithinimicrobium sp. F0845]|uniref:alpha/beta fold hydrolase n=1 Tax=Ornithinimicrobium sp. F0845 TaxID=2926412 RepID=UPI001FF6F78E|nr:alpha/beta hydrolase [Ornithinimicrobium sp. F0845]MCK0110571.1 alpha/beta hydrolase [Ornithinimicrobium sp. F0845]
MRYLLVPGAGGQAWYWHRLVPLLPDAVAVELPAADPHAGLVEYADTIVAAAGPDPGPVTVVAQSMGGLSAPLVCDGLDVRELVLVNAMIPRPGESGHEWWAATGHALSEPMEVMHHFFHDVPEDVTAEAMAMGEPQQTERPFDDPWPLPAWPDVPTRVLTGSHDRFFPPDFQRRVAQERLGLPVELVPGGHLAALSRPEGLAAALLGVSVSPRR